MSDWQHLRGSWAKMRGLARWHWDRLSNDDWDRIAGRRDQLAERIRMLYGVTKDEAEEQIESFLERVEMEPGEAARSRHTNE